ncbi:MAG: hypothetical protein AAF984_09825, partial [Verrucomicrobiota bacterium]
MKPIRSLTPAKLEFFEAVKYYAEIDSDLAERFILEFEGLNQQILKNPLILRMRRGGYRRIN